MTLRLTASLSHYWSRIDGQAAQSGVDPLDLPLDRLMSLTYAYLIKDADDEEAKKLDLKLWRPIPGRQITENTELGPWSAESETQAFKGLKTALNIKDPVAPVSEGHPQYQPGAGSATPPPDGR